MPYTAEHSARVHDPSSYDSFARKELTDGVSAVLGIKNGKSEVQAYRFDKQKFTPEEAKKWLSDNGVKDYQFEAAKKDEEVGKSNGFKYFVKVTKAFEDDGDWYVQGVATGTLEDRDEERMSVTVIKEFANALPMPLTDSHPRPGAIMGNLGEVVYAEVLDDDNNSLFIKAKLDKDNPAVPYMMKQIGEGKRYAFSIEGSMPKVQTVWSDRLKKMINEYIEIKPEAISITTEPSYIGSFLDVVSKSYNKLMSKTFASNETLNNNLDINSIEKSMKDSKKATKPDEITSEVKPEAEMATETPDAQPEVETQKVEGELGDKIESASEADNAQAEASNEASEANSEGEKPEELKKEAMADGEAEAEGEKPEEESKEESEGETEGETPESDVKEMVLTLASAVKAMSEKLDALVASDKEVHAQIGKSFKETENVMKSIHEDVEVMKDLPLQRKARTVAKTFEDRTENAPQTIRGVVEGLI